MFDMMGAVAPVDKNSLEIICALQLLRLETASDMSALEKVCEAQRNKIYSTTQGEAKVSALKENDEMFRRKRDDVKRISEETQKKIYTKAAGKYAKIVLAKR